ncbi:hypothetical protein SRB5_47950 [Streptomyces sp. RB5]|uniref:Uncharacterized protein n=1 Tax=Streptomyces smaragdinus TaxID=2585196 RepID=A0A7K0CMB8_9ACTN|nr:hypothetical protein [Streptomyces smaragdinus]MQY14626.1 hypothetical protein [Streptomyces smaragdinus]
MPQTFPDDLLRAQRDWYTVYRLLAHAAPGTPTTALRRRMYQLSVRVAAHPFWDTEAGTPAARVRLKQAAWDGGLPAERG